MAEIRYVSGEILKGTSQMWPVDLFSSTGNFYIMTITGTGSKFIRTIPRAIRKFITDHVGLRTVGLEAKTCPNSQIPICFNRKPLEIMPQQFWLWNTKSTQFSHIFWGFWVFWHWNRIWPVTAIFLVRFGPKCPENDPKTINSPTVRIWEFGHVLGSSRPLCGPTWSVMNFRNVRWVEPMNWGPGPYKVIIEKWPRIQLEVYWPHLIGPLSGFFQYSSSLFQEHCFLIFRKILYSFLKFKKPFYDIVVLFLPIIFQSSQPFAFYFIWLF